MVKKDNTYPAVYWSPEIKAEARKRRPKTIDEIKEEINAFGYKDGWLK